MKKCKAIKHRLSPGREIMAAELLRACQTGRLAMLLRSTLFLSVVVAALADSSADTTEGAKVISISADCSRLDAHEEDEHGHGRLHKAASSSGFASCIPTLLSSGTASLDDRNLYGHTAVHSAAWEGRADALRVLAEHGADINSVDQYGQTPLHLAALQHKLEAVGVLLHHGADTELKTAEGATASDLAEGQVLSVLEDFQEQRNVQTPLTDEMGNTFVQTEL